jgi:protein-disulfide isomerase
VKTLSKKIAALTFVALLGTAAPASAAPASAALDKAEVETIVRDYLVANPEVIVEALTSYQKKQEQAERDRFANALNDYRAEIEDPAAPFAGNPKGDIVIAEFYDYNCGYCKKALDDVVRIIEEDKDVKVIFHNLPILSESSHDAARWALAAGKQGKYFEYHSALMKHNGPLNTSILQRTGETLGLDVKKLEKDAEEDQGIREMIEKNLTLSRNLGIQGTPAFIIGDTLSPGYMGYDNLKAAVDAARAAKKK